MLLADFVMVIGYVLSLFSDVTSPFRLKLALGFLVSLCCLLSSDVVIGVGLETVEPVAKKF